MPKVENGSSITDIKIRKNAITGPVACFFLAFGALSILNNHTIKVFLLVNANSSNRQF